MAQGWIMYLVEEKHDLENTEQNVGHENGLFSSSTCEHTLRTTLKSAVCMFTNSPPLFFHCENSKIDFTGIVSVRCRTLVEWQCEIAGITSQELDPVLMHPMALNSTKSKKFSRNNTQYHRPSETADEINASMTILYTSIDELTYSIQDSWIIQWCNSIQHSSSSKMHFGWIILKFLHSYGSHPKFKHKRSSVQFSHSVMSNSL